MGLAIVACQGRKFVAEVLTEFEMIWSTKCFLVLLLVSVHQVHPFAIDDVPEEELVATQTVDVVADETVAESELKQYDNEDGDSEDTPPQLPPDIRYLKDIQEEQAVDESELEQYDNEGVFLNYCTNFIMLERGENFLSVNLIINRFQVLCRA